MQWCRDRGVYLWQGRLCLHLVRVPVMSQWTCLSSATYCAIRYLKSLHARRNLNLFWGSIFIRVTHVLKRDLCFATVGMKMSGTSDLGGKLRNVKMNATPHSRHCLINTLKGSNRREGDQFVNKNDCYSSTLSYDYLTVSTVRDASQADVLCI